MVEKIYFGQNQKIQNMKKLLLAFALIFSFTAGVYAQAQSDDNSNTNPNFLAAKAKNAAREAGCLDNYSGALEVQFTTISSCFAGGFVIEALVVPVCNGPGCETIRLAPLARVMFNCGNEPAPAECLR